MGSKRGEVKRMGEKKGNGKRSVIRRERSKSTGGPKAVRLKDMMQSKACK